MQSQKQIILNHLLQGNSITQLEAYDLCGCTRLSPRIAEIEENGHKVKHVMVKGRSRHTGQATRYCKYYLESEQ